MAKIHLTSGERLRVYDAVFQVNQSFHLIVTRLSDLDKLRMFEPKILAELRALTQEMQVEINHHLLENLTEVEHKDWHRYGKVRVRRQKQTRNLTTEPRRQSVAESQPNPTSTTETRGHGESKVKSKPYHRGHREKPRTRRKAEEAEGEEK